MFLQQADINSKSLMCLHRNAHLATYEAVGDMPPPSGAQQSMILIGTPGINSSHHCQVEYIRFYAGKW